MPAPYTPANRVAEIERIAKSTTACWLDGHQFWVAPRQLQAVYERVHTEVPTDNGIGRFSYGMRATQIQFQGWTGNGGLEELRALSRKMPSFTNKDVPHTFIYEPLDLSVVLYIDYYAKTNDQTYVYYVQYEIRGQELPPPSVAYQPLVTAVSSRARGVLGSLGG